MKILCFFSSLILCLPLQSQTSLVPAVQAGMGGMSAVSEDVTALFGNPAGISNLKKRSLIATGERRFFLADLSLAGAGIALPAKSGTFGLTLQSFGFQAFRQNQVRLGYARKMGEKFSAGLQFMYLQTRIPEYGSKGVISAVAGIQTEISKQLSLGVYVRNPVPQEWSEGENLPTIFYLGLAWKPAEKLLWAAELEKDIDFELRVRSGLDYLLNDAVSVRIGIATAPATFHFGLGYRLSNGLKLDAASGWHQTLGVTPAVSVMY